MKRVFLAALLLAALSLKAELKQLRERQTADLKAAVSKDEKKAVRLRYKELRKRIRERHRKMPK